MASLLKRGLLGTHQGVVSDQHLGAYLDEFVFRYNRRNARNRGLLFWRLVCNLTDARAPVAEQDLRRRREDQHDTDQAHAATARERRNAKPEPGTSA